MKNIVYLLNIFFMFSCSTIDKSNLDFIFSSKFYNEKKVETSEIFYDSQTGVFKMGRPEEIIVKLDNKDKQGIYSFYKELNLNSNSCWIKFEDSTSSKSNFIMKIPNFKEVKCNSTNKEEVNKHLMFYAKILRILRSKKEYQAAFPEEFEVY